jgi:alpha-glucuronidase
MYKDSKEEVFDRCWLNYSKIRNIKLIDHYRKFIFNIIAKGTSKILNTAIEELIEGYDDFFNEKPLIHNKINDTDGIIISKFSDLYIDYEDFYFDQNLIKNDGYLIKNIYYKKNNYLLIASNSDKGILYGIFHFLRLIKTESTFYNLSIIENNSINYRIINHWDNFDGTIERGYSGKSIFFSNDIIKPNKRIKFYAKLLSSIGINSIVLNNVNVKGEENYYITNKYLYKIKLLADVFRNYGIKVFISINFTSSNEIGNLDTSDPLNEEVIKWWTEKIQNIYSIIHDFGGFLVKADSEFRKGPYTYKRSHSQGANLFAKLLKPYGGLIIWRCFVYNCGQDWRNIKIDRAKAAYENFKPLDGEFLDNVILQIKNGPMDFQVREPVSPLFGAMKNTNQILEFQITQEYTGQQKDLCYLVPLWKELLEFNTFANNKDSKVSDIIKGNVFKNKSNGIAGVSNIGNDYNWTGNYLAQANLYGFGKIAWNSDCDINKITDEWIKLTFTNKEEVSKVIKSILLKSRSVYEDYTTPLGIGWMVNPGHHYGPNVNGYEYSKWGTYHKADHLKIGVDRTSKGTGFTKQYNEKNQKIFDSIEDCPEKFLLFFHRVEYLHKLKSGKTLIQHIYDSHFEGVESVKKFISDWMSIKDYINFEKYIHILNKFDFQLKNAMEWRDVINSYFYRITNIEDEKNREIYT